MPLAGARENSAGEFPRAETQWVLQLRDVTRLFAGNRALGPISLSCAPGTVCSIRGDNGSGKTTLLRLAAGLLVPSAGTRRGPGRALYLDARSAGRLDQTVQQALRFVARVCARPGASATQVAELVGLEDLTGTRLGALSSGQRARVTMAAARIAAPDLLCLDEPAVHLDPAGREVVRHTVATLAAAGTAVLLAGHDPELTTGLGHLTVLLRAGQAAEVNR